MCTTIGISIFYYQPCRICISLLHCLIVLIVRTSVYLILLLFLLSMFDVCRFYFFTQFLYEVLNVFFSSKKHTFFLSLCSIWSLFCAVQCDNYRVKKNWIFVVVVNTVVILNRSMAIIMRTTDNLNFKLMSELTISTLQPFILCRFIYSIPK